MMINGTIKGNRSSVLLLEVDGITLLRLKNRHFLISKESMKNNIIEIHQNPLKEVRSWKSDIGKKICILVEDHYGTMLLKEFSLEK